MEQPAVGGPGQFERSAVVERLGRPERAPAFK